MINQLDAQARYPSIPSWDTRPCRGKAVVGVRPELADNSETFDAVECFGASDVRRTDARKALYVNRHFSFGNTSAVTLG